uniref:WD40 repeat domain 95 n=1 Tax=Mus musculus TaxID=10090 RepID=D6RIJ3_MOUSE
MPCSAPKASGMQSHCVPCPQGSQGVLLLQEEEPAGDRGAGSNHQGLESLPAWVWDLETHGCCCTISSKASGIKGELTACLYLPGPRALCVATGTLAFLHLKVGSVPESHLVRSHQEPVVCCRYNPAFRHVVSCCEASVVKVWDFETGRQVSEFIGTHGNAGITCLTFDSSGRRLVTGGRDGCLKIWSYNNGHCLHTLQHGKWGGDSSKWSP